MKILKKTVLFTLSLGTNIEVPTQPPFEFTYELLYALVPFEHVSIRGAVMSLRDESFLSVFVRDGQTRIAITSVGREALKSLFPGLGNAIGRRDRSWTVCLFLDTVRDVHTVKKNSQTQSFRPLRDTLLSYGFYALERGMYVLPRVASQELIQELTRMKTLNRVMIFETRRLLVGDERQIISSLFPITKLSSLRQTIMKTLESVEKKGTKADQLHPQTRQSVITLLPKLMDFFTFDLTVPDVYFPQDILLSDTKSLLSRVCAEILPKI